MHILKIEKLWIFNVPIVHFDGYHSKMPIFRASNFNRTHIGWSIVFGKLNRSISYKSLFIVFLIECKLHLNH